MKPIIKEFVVKGVTDFEIKVEKENCQESPVSTFGYKNS